jgi:hypothetical protein
VVRAVRPVGSQGEDAVRQLILLVAVVGCAQLGAPPGGPEDRNPPHLLRISPDTNALNARPRHIELRFDEIINERPSQGGQDLANLFVLSPRRGRVDVRWRRSRLEIRPRRGWIPNTTYTLTQRRGVSDLRGNADTTEHRYMFTTGPTRSPSMIRGQVFDWVAARAAPAAYVEAVQLPDSLIYSEFADSLGRFAFRYLPPGRYLLRAVIDANTNRVFDRRELFDSATVTVTDSVAREMLAFVHDSAGPGLATAAVLDSLTIRLTFDRPLQPNVPVPASRFSLKASDSTVVPIASVLLGSVYEREQADSARAKTVRDSVRQAAIADSIRRANPQAAPRPVPPAAAPPRRPAVPVGPVRDTTPPPRPSVPSPETYAILRLTRPLATATSYRVHVDSLRSLMGIARSSDRVFITPPTRIAPDSTRPPNDSARPPGTPPVRRPPGQRELSLQIIRDLFAPTPLSAPGALGSRNSVPALPSRGGRPR